MSRNESSSSSSSSSVQVAVRVRPMQASEAGSTTCIETMQSSLNHDTNMIRIGGPSGPTFSFDQAFDGNAPQEFVFRSRVVPLIERCLEGYNATVLAYGQTGSGKTHTIMGPSTALQNGASAGLIPRAVRTLFDQLEQQNISTTTLDEEPTYEYEVRVQFLELYGEVIRDLLTPKPSSEKLTIRDIGNEEPEVLGATQQKVESADEALMCLTRGMLRRVTAETAMNASSSRSHAILSVMIRQTFTMDDNTEIKRSKFSFVDLAGSERLKRTQAQGQRMKEGVDINKGLLVLGNVISALGDEKKRGTLFVPYRDSKLTRLLKGSLGGNHKTLMIACISPSSNNLEESLNCLRYANRAKNIQNNAVVNVDAGSRLVSELRGQVKVLSTELLRITKGTDPTAERDGLSMAVLQILSSMEGSVSGWSHPNTPTNQLDAAESIGAQVSLHFNERLQRLDEVKIELEHTKGVLLHTSQELHKTREELMEIKAQQGYTKKQEEVPVRRNMIDGVVYSKSKPSPWDTANHLKSTTTWMDPEIELHRTKGILLATNKELQVTTEDLFTARAEKEMYRLRLNAGNPTDVETAFLAKAVSYESEIESLKQVIHNKKHLPGNEESFSSVNNAKSSNEKRTQLMAQLQGELLTSISPEKTNCLHPIDNDSLELLRLRSNVIQSISPNDQLDAEEKAEQAELAATTSKFLDNEGGDESNLQTDQEDTTIDEVSQRHRQLIEASLVELTNSIDEKENLIEQLLLSEEKYSDMRDFYEEKLKQMENQVREREREREALVRELEERQASKSDTKDLMVRLKEKETHISSLKKRQVELMGLTKVSSKNETEISRLRHDVISMKQKKVDMQNLISQERKSHIGEIQRLKKESIQLDREVNRWKKISERKTFEAEQAQRVSKFRLEEVGSLRAKYKGAAPNLRVKTVKRGVMEKAGLDPVLLGGHDIKNKVFDEQKGARATPKVSEPDIDSMRAFLNNKIADFCRKEGIADKLANEWEDHMDHMSQKQLLLEDLKRGIDISDEELEAVDVQLQYKEARIRQLAQRLGKQSADRSQQEQLNDILGEKDYISLFRNSTPLAAAQQTCRVLFGMVVKERRRVAMLARTASSLDEKATLAEKVAKEKDDAFRSYVEEERHERAALAQEQQEQILSLMEMVKYDDKQAKDLSTFAEGMPLSHSTTSASSVFILATERNEALERQLLELRDCKKNADMYKAKERDCSRVLASKNEECEKLHRQTNSMRSTLRQIREAIIHHIVDTGIESSNGSSFAAGPELNREVLTLISNALRSRQDDNLKNLQGDSFSSADEYVFPLLKQNDTLMHNSDSEEDDDVPDWAGDIIADLAVIADGEIPASLLNSPTFFDMNHEPKGKNTGSVFDRLTNPDNFTGVQKQNTARRNGNQKAWQERRDLARKVSANLEKLEKMVTPDLKSASEDVTQGEHTEMIVVSYAESKIETNDRQERRSVFDRLLSPSAYTGTHKDRIQRFQQTQRPDKDDETSHLLDDILGSESDGTVDQCERDITVQVAEKVAEYTQQNVFERLQTKTTQSYAGKHGKQNVAANRSIALSPGRTRLSEGDAGNSPSKDLLDNMSHNVFKRLQQTETQAYSKKKNIGVHKSEIGKPSRVIPGEPEELIDNDDPYDFVERDYVGQNVFERLQRTTTQSFAGKYGVQPDEKSDI